MPPIFLSVKTRVNKNIMFSVSVCLKKLEVKLWRLPQTNYLIKLLLGIFYRLSKVNQTKSRR